MNLDEFTKLNDLKKSGILSQEEFEQAKAKILAGESFASKNCSAVSGSNGQTIIYNSNTQSSMPSYVSEDPLPKPIKSRLTYLFLAFFLGLFGGHNFYAGYVGRGIAQLLITLFLGWLIVPLLMVIVWVVTEMIYVKKDVDERDMKPIDEVGKCAFLGCVFFVVFVILVSAYRYDSCIEASKTRNGTSSDPFDQISQRLEDNHRCIRSMFIWY